MLPKTRFHFRRIIFSGWLAPSVTRFQGSKGGSRGSFSRRQTAIFAIVARKREGRRGLVRFPGPARVLNNADHLLSLPEISRESSSDLTAQEPTLRGIVPEGEERWCPRCPVKPRGKRPRTMIIIIIMIKITIIIIMAVERWRHLAEGVGVVGAEEGTRSRRLSPRNVTA